MVDNLTCIKEHLSILNTKAGLKEVQFGQASLHIAIVRSYQIYCVKYLYFPDLVTARVGQETVVIIYRQRT